MNLVVWTTVLLEFIFLNIAYFFHVSGGKVSFAFYLSHQVSGLLVLEKGIGWYTANILSILTCAVFSGFDLLAVDGSVRIVIGIDVVSSLILASLTNDNTVVFQEGNCFSWYVGFVVFFT